MGYIITIIALLVFYIVAIYMMKYVRHPRVLNYVFIALVYIPYVSLCTIVYRDVGFYDWNFRNTLPVANVSPFMFSLMPILLILPKKAKEYVFLLISLLSVGMLVSTILGCAYNASINYKFHFHFLLDYVAHILLSLFGIHLIRSKQVEFNVKNCLISSSVIFAAATVMVILNLIFDTSFFGLSLRGKHNIYNNVLVSNSYLSALLYYLGLGVVLMLGYIVSKKFSKKPYID